MVFEDLIGGSAPFVTGMIIFLGFVIGCFIMRIPLEFGVLVGIPFALGVVAYYVPAITPILAIASGIAIGFMFLKIVRR